MKKVRQKEYYKNYWRTKTKEEFATQRKDGNFFESEDTNLYTTKAPMREYDRLTRELYKQFGGTDIKVKGTNRATNVYAEAYRLMTNKPTSTRGWFEEDLHLREDIEEIDLQKEYIAERFGAMASKYEDVAVSLQDYVDGKIDYTTFIAEVEDFRKTNEDYLKAKYSRK